MPVGLVDVVGFSRFQATGGRTCGAGNETDDDLSWSDRSAGQHHRANPHAVIGIQQPADLPGQQHPGIVPGNVTKPESKPDADADAGTDAEAGTDADASCASRTASAASTSGATRTACTASAKP